MTFNTFLKRFVLILFYSQYNHNKRGYATTHPLTILFPYSWNIHINVLRFPKHDVQQLLSLVAL